MSIRKPCARFATVEDVTSKESSLIPLGEVGLRWHVRRFDIFCNGKQPADVFDTTLIRDDYPVETQHSGREGSPNTPAISLSLVPTLRWKPTTNNIRTSKPPRQRPLWRRAPSRLKRAMLVLLRG